MSNELSPVQKKIKKVVEEVIVQYADEFKEKYSENEIEYAIKHKAQVSKIGVSDDRLESLIKEEVEDCLGAYLFNKKIK